MHRYALISCLALATAAAGCDGIPQDPRHTAQAVHDAGQVRVGLVAGAEPARSARPEDLADVVARANHVKLAVRTAPADALMHELKTGDLDLVVGVFPKSSPWSKEVAFSGPYPKMSVPKDEPVVRAAAHRGENRWLLSVDRAIAEASR